MRLPDDNGFVGIKAAVLARDGLMAITLLFSEHWRQRVSVRSRPIKKRRRQGSRIPLNSVRAIGATNVYATVFAAFSNGSN
jgi:2-methylcitrate dehydratase PrpD